MVDNDRKSSSDRRARQRPIRAEIARIGDPYSVVARRHDEREELRREARNEATKAPMARCPRCRQAEVSFDDQLSCPGCGAVWESGAELTGEYAEESLGLDSYSSIKDGGEDPTSDCSGCWEQAVVMIQPEDATFWTMMCMACESLYNDRCTRCSTPIQHRDEDDSIVCMTCWNDVLSRP